MIVVKFGGHAMVDESGAFGRAIASALNTGESVVVVHGGGPQIDEALKLAGVTSNFIGGFRVTTPEVFKVVERVLTQEVGPRVVQTLIDCGIQAQSISGRSLPTISSQRRTTLVDGSVADLGLVGDVVSIDISQVIALVENGVVPVIAPISAEIGSENGLNVNADLAAASLAGALDASVLIIMTDVPGIYRHWPDTSSLIDSITSEELSAIKSTFSQGMAPKVAAALDAIEQGAKAVRIIDGTDANSFAAALAGTGGTLVLS